MIVDYWRPNEPTRRHRECESSRNDRRNWRWPTPKLLLGFYRLVLHSFPDPDRVQPSRARRPGVLAELHDERRRRRAEGVHGRDATRSTNDFDCKAGARRSPVDGGDGDGFRVCGRGCRNRLAVICARFVLGKRKEVSTRMLVCVRRADWSVFRKGGDAESGSDKEDENGDCLKASESKALKPVEVIGNGEKKAEEAKEEEEEENKKDGDKENEAARHSSTATTKSDEPALPDRRPLSPGDSAVRGSPLTGHKDARGRGGGGGDSPRLPPQRLFSRSKASPHTPTKEMGPPLPESNAKRPLPREREATPPAAAAVEDDEDDDTLYAKVTNQHQHRPRAVTLDDVTYAEPEVPSTRKAFTLPAKGRSSGGGGGGVSFDLTAYESDPDADTDSMYATPTLEPKKQEEEKEKKEEEEEDASGGAVVYAQPSKRPHTSPAPPADVDKLYAKVDKEKKTSSSPKSDLYAQPHKHGKGVQLDHHATASLGEDGYSHVKLKPKEAHGYSKVGPPAAAGKVQHDELGYAVVDKKIGSEDDPDYEKVAFGEGSGSAKKADVPDPGYEKVGPDSGVMKGDDPDYEKVNIAENIKKKKGDIPDPGYEKVGPNSDVMARGKEGKEPDYEKVGPDSKLMKGKSEKDVPDPGYEKLGSGSGGGGGNSTNASSPVDPNYEDVGEVRQRAVSLDRDDDDDGDDAVPPAPAGKREAASLPLSPIDPNYDEIDDDFRKRIEEFQQKDTDDKEA